LESPLAEIRARLGLRKEDLAIILDISLPTLNRIETGVAKVPEKCFQGLRDLKQNPEKIVEQQILFIEEKKRQILKSLKLGKD
jgi:DNA-binding XRE family transcriptional regulator